MRMIKIHNKATGKDRMSGLLTYHDRATGSFSLKRT